MNNSNKGMLENACEGLINENTNPIKTGFKDIDCFLLGLEKGSLITIGSRPSMGKSTFAMSLMENVIKNGKKCLFFSLGMSAKMFTRRLLIQYSETSAMSLMYEPKRPNNKEIAKLKAASEELSGFNYLVKDKEVKVEEIEAQIEEYRPDFVFINYLQLITTPKKLQRVDAISEIMRNLKTIAKEKSVTIFIISQLSRKLEDRFDRHPMLSDLKESGAIEEISDIVMFIYREEYYDKENCTKGTAEIIIAKNKYGPTGTVRLGFRGEIPKFCPLKVK